MLPGYGVKFYASGILLIIELVSHLQVVVGFSRLPVERFILRITPVLIGVTLSVPGSFKLKDITVFS